MVGPSIDAEGSRSFMFKFRIGFAIFVGLSMALVSAHGGAALPLAGAMGLVGAAVGAGLAWWVFPDSMSRLDGRRGRR
ncbi:hypothetical protein [Halomicrobium urmianum]|uniref:hypothetical protein n=1 Tax=Halomicrobium urmianum TaxID=1586233 RepID=UPI001CDA4938|nr:hypothetical protein [Halomicrobium urmianum]